MQRPDEKKTGHDWNWASYFAAKKQKLYHQFKQDRIEQDSSDDTKNIFHNIGIIVNGYTNPTAIELKALMIKHGGYYFEYMNEKVNYIVASNLAHSKALALRNKTVIRPEWIVDCIKAKKLLSIDNYLLITSVHDKAQNKLCFSNKKANIKEESKSKKNISSAYIDISKSPVRENDDVKNEIEGAIEKYSKDYKLFQAKLKQFQATSMTSSQIKNLNKKEARVELVKSFLNDWILWTSNKNCTDIKYSYFGRENQQDIDNEEIQIFKNYLFYLLLVKEDLEMVRLVLKIMKRLIQVYGSFEWTENFKDLSSCIQSEFFEKYDVTLNLD
ncbi:unnamed protein product [Brachionus calyciflorus]|uniref:BRCT domain-containing protein n=1 Tax=Brachionus calyciflorus TaxID=104777 RepID=A0A813VHR7_9BILA|nr:unnamed protein product [Brachionus calyciflorus]